MLSVYYIQVLARFFFGCIRAIIFCCSKRALFVDPMLKGFWHSKDVFVKCHCQVAMEMHLDKEGIQS